MPPARDAHSRDRSCREGRSSRRLRGGRSDDGARLDKRDIIRVVDEAPRLEGGLAVHIPRDATRDANAQRADTLAIRAGECRKRVPTRGKALT